MTTLNQDLSRLHGQESTVESGRARTYTQPAPELYGDSPLGCAKYRFSRDLRPRDLLLRGRRIAFEFRHQPSFPVGFVLTVARSVEYRQRAASTYSRYHPGNGIEGVFSNRLLAWISEVEDGFIVTLISSYVVLTGFYLSARMGTKWRQVCWP